MIETLTNKQERILSALESAANIYSGDFKFEFVHCGTEDDTHEEWTVKCTHEDIDFLVFIFDTRVVQDGNEFPEMDFSEDSWEEISQESFYTYAFFESITDHQRTITTNNDLRRSLRKKEAPNE